ncbi:alpha,alpha-phosphotrehalase [Terrilactibacillus sp. BCM23-1]|uniref:Alpha,alpha-phosphotrehalase n=1 Tax=Terrilactibacillus tamarindi TaxID=2599694 RepID=A0A6N8CMG3_9BACI|nr:alpha,alpha-phosphotrehalase [Terrilactibacillus tamarindi]MTT30798.1 alpha,alpha-phosphotrehalase [Terrilactibacillus tamarindi]
MKEAWWKRSTVYQIYPKSFYDTTGNGIGDLQGIIEKLDYLKDLGVDILWLTPIYKSPQKDNGYDISDYYQIQEEFGTMEDFDQLLEKAHAKGLKIVMDMVVNHTSTEHEWFKAARKDKNSPYRDYYIWKDSKNGGDEPTNWLSKFGGSAWAYDEKTEQYYLHLFDVTQADLNWENDAMKEDIYKMMHYWFEKGIDGFRLDVINLISKDQRFLDDDRTKPQADGRKYYTDGPRIHEYIHELNKHVFSKYRSMTVGEMSSTTIPNCIDYTKPENQELDMIFQFHHLKVDYPNGEKWAMADFDFLALKKLLSNWQVKMHEGGGWQALFWCNHDQPRIVSRFGDEGEYREQSAKMLATTIHMMQGTPYIYQGEEIGMTNPNFTSITDYRDVESLNMYTILQQQGKSEQEIISILKQKSRDNSRTPMQWDGSQNGGFTKGTPWINVSNNFQTINVKRSLLNHQSVYYHYKKLIDLRKQMDIITYGDYQLLLEDDPSIFSYVRRWKGETLLVVNNFYNRTVEFNCPLEIQNQNTQQLLSNYIDSPNKLDQTITLRPYESIVYYLSK